MVDLQGQIVPETEAEWELLNNIYDVTAHAEEEGVRNEDIVLMLTFAAASVQAFGDEEPPERPDVDPPETHCPECGERIDDVLTALGGHVEVLPCGCDMEVDDLPGRFDV